MFFFAQHVEGQGAQQGQHLYTVSLGVGMGVLSKLGVTGGINYLGGSVPCSLLLERSARVPMAHLAKRNPKRHLAGVGQAITNQAKPTGASVFNRDDLVGVALGEKGCVGRERGNRRFACNAYCLLHRFPIEFHAFQQLPQRLNFAASVGGEDGLGDRHPQRLGALKVRQVKPGQQQPEGEVRLRLAEQLHTHQRASWPIRITKLATPEESSWGKRKPRSMRYSGNNKETDLIG